MIKLIVAFCALSFTVFASEVDSEGHNPGKFTQDFEAAKKYAAEKNLPILINFTGSDWCHWCKVMDKNVFVKEAWTAYAKENLVMVWIDFPKNKSLVPENYVARNQEMASKYGVRGYPTYIVLNAKADKTIGRLTAGQNKTPASFKGEVEGLVAFLESNVKSFANSLPEDKGKKYVEMFETIQKNEADKKEHSEKIKELTKSTAKLKEEMEIVRATAKMDEAQVKAYMEVRKELSAAEADLKAFLDSKPSGTAENRKKYQDMQKKCNDLKAKLSAL